MLVHANKSCYGLVINDGDCMSPTDVTTLGLTLYEAAYCGNAHDHLSNQKPQAAEEQGSLFKAP